MPAVAATYGIAALATGGVILRPFRWPEAVWALSGALLLVLSGLLPAAEAWRGVLRGTDVYLFLIGMMLLAEIANQEGLFAWLAAHAARAARGSARRLFVLVYAVGTLVTVFLSNDATAVVLTPAVAAIARTARARDAVPFLFICAFIANAASFVLPISNPANLVIYGSRMPSLLEWLPRFALPSAAAILVTFAMLWLTQRSRLREPIETAIAVPALPVGGRAAALGIVATGVLLLAVSALDRPLGLPTCIAGVATALFVLLRERRSPRSLARRISWGVLPLVAGLFVLVQALERAGLLDRLAELLHALAAGSVPTAVWSVGGGLAVLCNLVNNLPAGLLAGGAVQAAHVPPQVTGAVLIGVDLGPNLSVTGSLATILWLTAIRREQQAVGAWRFLKLGLLVMPPALVAALGALLLTG